MRYLVKLRKMCHLVYRADDLDTLHVFSDFSRIIVYNGNRAEVLLIGALQLLNERCPCHTCADNQNLLLRLGVQAGRERIGLQTDEKPQKEQSKA